MKGEDLRSDGHWVTVWQQLELLESRISIYLKTCVLIRLHGSGLWTSGVHPAPKVSTLCSTSKQKIGGNLPKTWPN